MYKTWQEAEEDVAKMSGWDNIRIIEEPGDIYGPIIYIRAIDPASKRPVVFDSPDNPQARFI